MTSAAASTPALGSHVLSRPLAGRRRRAAVITGIAAMATVGGLVVAPAALAAGTVPTYFVAPSIPVGNYLSGVAVDSGLHRAYVTDIAVGAVRVVDLTTRQTVASVPVGSQPYYSAVDTVTHTAYAVSYSGGTLTAIDGTTNRAVATVRVGTNPEGIAVDTATRTVYVANTGSDSVSVVDGATNTVTATIPVGRNPGSVAVDPTTRKVYVGNGGSQTVSVVDGATNTVTATIPVQGNPYGVAVDPTSHRVYVANFQGGNFYVIDGTTDTVLKKIITGANNSSVAVDPAKGTYFLTNYFARTVSVFDAATDTVTQTLAVGRDPNVVAVDTGTHVAYVVNQPDAALAVIRPVPVPTATNLSAGDTSLVTGEPVTFTATVTVTEPDSPNVVGTPTGTVRFATADGTTIPGCAAQPLGDDLTANCTATAGFAASTSPVQVQARYSGDDGYATSTSDPVEVSVTAAATTTTLAADPTDVTAGDTVTFTATVAADAPGAGTPTGTVGFATTGGTTLTGCDAVALSGGQAQCVVTTGGGAAQASPVSVVATYAGSADFAGSSSEPVDVVVRTTPTFTTVSADNATVVSGQSVTFTAEVGIAEVSKAAKSGAEPTGTVSFSFVDGATVPGCAAVPLDDTLRAQCVVTGGFRSSETSSVSVTAAYSGDGTFTGSVSDPVAVAVTKADVLVSVTGDPNPPVRGQPTTFTAVVSAVAPGTGTPTGTATFTITAPNGTRVNCAAGSNTVTLTTDAQGNGVAQCVAPKNTLLGGRKYTVDVAYSGDGDFASQTGSLGQTVSRANTSTAVTTSPDSVVSGQPVTVTATVSVVAPGSGKPNGKVTFTVSAADGTRLECADGNTVVLTNQRSVSCAIAAGNVAAAKGPYAVAVSYSGSRGFAPSTGTTSITVAKATSTTRLTQSSAASAQGQPVTFTATIFPAKAAYTAPAPFGGTVTFTVTGKDGSTVTCAGSPAAPAADGTVSCTVAGSDLTAANSPYTVTAVWSGDGSYSGSQATVTHKVTRR